MNWNFNPSEAPKGYMEQKTVIIAGNVRTQEVFVQERILAANKDGRVYATYWIPTQLSALGNKIGGDRWSGWCEGDEPVAWAHWPEHPMAGGV